MVSNQALEASDNFRFKRLSWNIDLSKYSYRPLKKNLPDNDVRKQTWSFYSPKRTSVKRFSVPKEEKASFWVKNNTLVGRDKKKVNLDQEDDDLIKLVLQKHCL
mmetsp:Transcript_31314/g.30690  ORF Transcript_31314/g.30690 Transcript_31314/m.30690 type:complete len:104 (+) Transcript_31314:359-670(+)